MAAVRVAVIAVMLAIVVHYATIFVPPTLTTSEQLKLRVLAAALDMNYVLRSFPTNAHVHITNFMQSAPNVLSSDDPSVKYTDMRIDNGVKIRVYEPIERSSQLRAGLVYLHGGGFVYGNIHTHHTLTHHLAAELDVVLISVDYRKSWQEQFPATLDDCMTATIWLMHNAQHYHVDPNRIAIAGDSAGGNVAAVVAAKLTYDERYANLPKLKFQGLLYAPFQGLDMNTPSYLQQYGMVSSVGATKELLVYCYIRYEAVNKSTESNIIKRIKQAMMVNNHTTPKAKLQFAEILSHNAIPDQYKVDGYKPETYDVGDVEIFDMIKGSFLNPEAAPLMREDLRGLPPAYIVTTKYDPLRDDSLMYARRLEKAGVEVDLRIYDNGIHGLFMMFQGPLSIEAGKQSVRDFIDYGRKNL